MTARAVIFDMDGVLVDSEPLWQEAVIGAFRSIGVPLSAEEAVEIKGMRVDALVEYWHRRYPWQSPAKPEVEALVRDTIIRFIGERGAPKAGAVEALEFFQRRGVPLGLASSSPLSVIRAVLDKLGIEAFFSVVYSAESEPHGKPHPGVYLTTAERLGVPPAECVAVEDSLPGVLAAKSANLTCICVPDPTLVGDRRLAIADYVIPSLGALDERLWARIAAPAPPAGSAPPFHDLAEAALDEVRRAVAAVDPADIAALRKAILRAPRIFTAGKGRSGLQMEAFAMRLSHLGLAVHGVGAATTPGLAEGDLLLLGSASGRTASLVEYARRAAALDAPVGLITASATGPLAQQAACRVLIPAPTPKNPGQSVTSAQPLGTLFESALGLVLDVVVLQLMHELNVGPEEMFARHANLE